MPVHDWSKVDAGIFHAFHGSWITHLMGAMNGGVLPAGYYALAEQHAGLTIPDVMTLRRDERGEAPAPNGGITLINAPPRVGRRLVASSKTSYATLRRTLTVRGARGGRLVAIVEIVSPGNKDRERSVNALAEKIQKALTSGIHVLLIDLFAPGRHDPLGMHGAAWSYFDPDASDAPPSKSATLASYLADRLAEAFVEFVPFGEPLPDMPLFIESLAHVLLPLDTTYTAAFRDMPAVYREELE